MATEIYLGLPPARIRNWIMTHRPQPPEPTVDGVWHFEWTDDVFYSYEDLTDNVGIRYWSHTNTPSQVINYASDHVKWSEYATGADADGWYLGDNKSRAVDPLLSIGKDGARGSADVKQFETTSLGPIKWYASLSEVPFRQTLGGVWYVPSTGTTYSQYSDTNRYSHAEVSWYTDATKSSGICYYASAHSANLEHPGWYYYTSRPADGQLHDTPIAQLNEHGVYGDCSSKVLTNNVIGSVCWYESIDKIPTHNGVWYLTSQSHTDIFNGYVVDDEHGFAEWSISEPESGHRVWIEYVYDYVKAQVQHNGWYLTTNNEMKPLVELNSDGEYGAANAKVLESTQYGTFRWVQNEADIPTS